MPLVDVWGLGAGHAKLLGWLAEKMCPRDREPQDPRFRAFLLMALTEYLEGQVVTYEPSLKLNVVQVRPPRIHIQV